MCVQVNVVASQGLVFLIGKMETIALISELPQVLKNQEWGHTAQHSAYMETSTLHWVPQVPQFLHPQRPGSSADLLGFNVLSLVY